MPLELGGKDPLVLLSRADVDVVLQVNRKENKGVNIEFYRRVAIKELGKTIRNIKVYIYFHSIARAGRKGSARFAAARRCGCSVAGWSPYTYIYMYIFIYIYICRCKYKYKYI